MEQWKETGKLIFNWLGNGKKTIIGVGFLLIGFLWNMAGSSVHTLEQIPFIIMVAGALSLVNALFSKLTAQNINLLLFVLIYVCILELGIYLMGGETADVTELVLIWGACSAFIWALNYALLETTEMDGIVKRIVVAFFETLIGVAAIVAVFAIPIWLAA